MQKNMPQLTFTRLNEQLSLILARMVARLISDTDAVHVLL